jgi:translation initiation factor 3 subunit A
VVKAVDVFSEQAELKVYAESLQRVAVLRVLLQLSHVFSTIKIDFLKKLLAPLKDISYLQIERIMVDGISKKQLQMKIDHGKGCLNFATSSASKDTNVTMDNHISTLDCNLTKISLSLSADVGTEDRAQRRQEYLAKVAASAPAEHEALLERKKLIERRKEDMERLQKLREDRERKEAELAAEQRRQDEEERLQLETAARELDKRKKLSDRMEIIRIQKELERFQITKTETELTDIGKDAREMLLLDAKAGAKKGKDDESRRVTEQAKRIDHLTRALRLEGAKLIGRMYAETTASDKANYDAKKQTVMETMKDKHAADLVTKQRLAKMQPHRGAFQAIFVREQEAAYHAHMANKRDRAIKESRQKLVARARRAASDALEEAEEAEAQAAADAERIAAEAISLREQERLAEEEQRIREKKEERERAEEERRERQAPSRGGPEQSSRPMFGDKSARAERGSDMGSGERPVFGANRGSGMEGAFNGGRGGERGGDRDSMGPSGGEDGRADGPGGWARRESSARDERPSGGFSASRGSDRDGGREGGFGASGGGFQRGGGDRDSREPSRADSGSSWGKGERMMPERAPAPQGGGGGSRWTPGGGAGAGGDKPRGLAGAFGDKSGARPAFGASRTAGARPEGGNGGDREGGAEGGGRWR